ncbi:unnamed protein product [Rhizophagus irregularis]|uniref:Uncharacterized protein n=1 Tax=Rhizophagus irregularis TaxID=588596 RepID=A0A915Z2G9_9GLOM|nr:unnamed protein product [Rhizophagus irregularis]
MVQFCYFVLLYEEFGMERFGDYDVSRMARGSRTVIKGGKNWPVNLEKIFENITIHNVKSSELLNLLQIHDNFLFLFT